jgi:hypothetical protein
LRLRLAGQFVEQISQKDVTQLTPEAAPGRQYFRIATDRGGVMAERPRTRAPTVVSRKRRQLFRGSGPWPDATEALTALARAWTVTTIATAIFLAALAAAPMWDSAIFLQALRDALGGDPQLTQPIDEAPAGASAGREIPRAL